MKKQFLSKEYSKIDCTQCGKHLAESEVALWQEDKPYCKTCAVNVAVNSFVSGKAERDKSLEEIREDELKRKKRASSRRIMLIVFIGTVLICLAALMKRQVQKPSGLAMSRVPQSIAHFKVDQKMSLLTIQSALTRYYLANEKYPESLFEISNTTYLSKSYIRAIDRDLFKYSCTNEKFTLSFLGNDEFVVRSGEIVVEEGAK